MARETVIAANWKMYKNRQESRRFVEELRPWLDGVSHRVLLAPPYTAIQELAEAVQGLPLEVGAQNLAEAREGAFTGEVSAEMLTDVGARFVIVGHSERRQLFGEGYQMVNRKVLRALEAGLQPLLCVGETLDEREAGRRDEVLEAQLRKAFTEMESKVVGRCLLAYEPVWAIGTGKTATPQTAQEAHAFLRRVLGREWGEEVARSLPILYGGSVKPENAADLMAMEDVDGLLVGGASLLASSFARIVRFGEPVLAKEKKG